MRKLIVLLLLLSLSSSVFSQEIEMKHTFWGLKFTQNDQNLKLNEVVEAVESNLEAYELVKKGKKQHTIYNVLGGVGGALIGFPIGQSIGGGDANWTLAYIGGGLAAISIPFAMSSYNNLNKGVDTYNLSLKSANTYQFKPKFNVYPTGTGLGLNITF